MTPFAPTSGVHTARPVLGQPDAGANPIPGDRRVIRSLLLRSVTPAAMAGAFFYLAGELKRTETNCQGVSPDAVKY